MAVNRENQLGDCDACPINPSKQKEPIKPIKPIKPQKELNKGRQETKEKQNSEYQIGQD
jgi:hypothetical protein